MVIAWINKTKIEKTQDSIEYSLLHIEWRKAQNSLALKFQISCPSGEFLSWRHCLDCVETLIVKRTQVEKIRWWMAQRSTRWLNLQIESICNFSSKEEESCHLGGTPVCLTLYEQWNWKLRLEYLVEELCQYAQSIFVIYSSGCPLKFCVDGSRPCDQASDWFDIPFDSRTLSCNPNISSRAPQALSDKRRIPAQPEKGSLIDGLQAERMDSCLVRAGVLEDWRCLLVGIAVLFHDFEKSFHAFSWKQWRQKGMLP